MSKFSIGNDIYWFRGESIHSGRIFMIYTTYIVTSDGDHIDIDDCYNSKQEAINGMRKDIDSLDND